ncbi:hypothetical protein RvY_08345 [Ramazzottius varieornatus]|uniref:Glycosyltransferase family 92 protein n=1 Tax=Ramazzottius varieornatus TaxID=947166 RepID=A0A1D1VA56_RAMVA|nr:hypothetical protein RvY_08345 [Ramazzottius varieornatus]
MSSRNMAARKYGEFVLNILLAVVAICQSISTLTSERKVPSSVKGNITVCTYVRDGMPHVLEWIEFHRLQGVDKFLLYDDGSVDTTASLGWLYRNHERHLQTMVEVYPSNQDRWNMLPDDERSYHNDNQLLALNHCNKRSANRTRWLLNIDVDEFVYSPQPNSTLWDFLQGHSNLTTRQPTYPSNETVAQFYFQVVRFGSNGRQRDVRGEIDLNPHIAQHFLHSVDYVSRAEQSLHMNLNPKRAPHQDLDNDYKALFRRVCESVINASYDEDCSHANGKAIWIPDRCAKAGVHWCEVLEGSSRDVPLEQMRIDHYPFQTKEHVEKLIPSIKSIKGRVYKTFDAIWFSLVPDNTSAFLLQRLVDRLLNIPGYIGSEQNCSILVPADP